MRGYKNFEGTPHPGDLCHLVEIGYTENAINENGYPEPKDVVLCRVWASAVDAGNQHYRAADVMNTEQVINFTIRYRKDVKPGMWVKFQDEKWIISTLGEYASDSSKQVVHCVIQRNGFICFRLLQTDAHHRVKVRIAHGIAGNGMRRHRHGKRHSAPHDDLSVQRIDQHRDRETELRQDALGLLFNFRLNASHYVGTLSHTITPFN